MKHLLSAFSGLILGAMVSLTAHAVPFGYFVNEPDPPVGSGNPAAAIAAAGHTSVALTGLTALDLAGIDVLWILNGDNEKAPADLIANSADVAAFVFAGGVLSYHDRYVSVEGGASTNNAVIPGAAGITFVRDFDDDFSIDIVTGGTLITSGPGGVIGGTTLDGGDSSSHGYVLAATVPLDAVSIFSQTDSSHIVDLFYRYGAGWVYYSTIPLDHYLFPAGNNPPGDAMRDIYAVNEAAFQASLLEAQLPEPASLALLALGLLFITMTVGRRKTARI